MARILVVRQHDQLGDMLCVVPLLRALRHAFPGGRISLVASPLNAEIMRHHPFVDEILVYDKRRFLRSQLSFLRFCRSIRAFHADLTVVPATVSMSVTSDLIGLLSGAPGRIGAGALAGQSNPSAFCFNRPVTLDWSDDPHHHHTLRNLDILAPLGIREQDLTCVIGLSAEERRAAAEELAASRSGRTMLVGMHPGAGKKENRWDARRFAAIADRLAAELNAGVVVTAGPMDDEPLAIFLGALRTARPLVVHNRPLRGAAALIDGLDLFVTNDTGIMHVAGATSTRVLSLFGPTDPRQWAPIGPKNRYITSKDGNINSITEQEVFDAMRALLGSMTAGT